MAVGKRIKNAFKGEEELKIVFWRGFIPGTIALILLARYILFPYLGIGISLAVTFLWIVLSAFCLKRCWCNCSGTFQEESTALLKFLGVVWLSAVLMSPILYMLYFQD